MPGSKPRVLQSKHYIWQIYFIHITPGQQIEKNVRIANDDEHTLNMHFFHFLLRSCKINFANERNPAFSTWPQKRAAHERAVGGAVIH
jgi:hypothetical protein